MRLVILLFLLGFSSYLVAAEFDGCGEYQFRGVLKADNEAPYKMIYMVHQGNRSEMIFQIEDKDDAMKLAPMLDMPSTFTANIAKQMNGTKGVFVTATNLAKRFPDPLSSNDSGIKKLKSLKCR